MHGLVSLLDEQHYTLVEDLWRELHDDCGLQGIYVTPLPHFSWQIAEDYYWDELETALKQLANETKPFCVRTAGLSLFTGQAPVVYIPVVRTRELSEFHEKVWERILPFSKGISPLYSPPFWIPHISLAYQDVDHEKLHCLMEKLAFRTFNWEIMINNLTLIYEPDGTIGRIENQFEFISED